MKEINRKGVPTSVQTTAKGQMEMVGLVVIVILITLGMLFLAQFALQEDHQKKIFTRKGLAYSTMSALLKTSIAENCAREAAQAQLPQLGKDILEDCALYVDTQEGGSSLYRCNNQHSCKFSQEYIEERLAETLGAWNKQYEFTSRLVLPEGDETILLVQAVGGSGCPLTKERDSSELFYLHTDAGLIESVLYLCD